MEIIKPLLKAANKVVLVLKGGGVVICPTDTVYGFLADAQNKRAVDKIFKVKKRPKLKPLPIFVKDIKMAKKLAIIDKKTAKILKKFWPGKYTFILKRKAQNEKRKVIIQYLKLYGVDKNTLAIRIPKYNFLNQVLKKINKPLVQTSVNVSGQKPLKKVDDIIKKFSGKKEIALIVNGGYLKKTKPSVIIDLTDKKLKRLR